MKDYRRLAVWEKAHQITMSVYRITAAFPDTERFGITSQLRRAASSIPTNIAEGSGRGSDRDFVRFIHIAAGSASETEYLIFLSSQLGYVSNDTSQQVSSLCSEVRRMLYSLSKKLTPDA